MRQTSIAPNVSGVERGARNRMAKALKVAASSLLERARNVTAIESERAVWPVSTSPMTRLKSLRFISPKSAPNDRVLGVGVKSPAVAQSADHARVR